MGRDELKQALDFILNDADDGEFEVLVKAVQRRQRDNSLFSSAGSMRPDKFAKKASGELQGRLGMSMESLRGTMRDFVADLIRKEMPEISDADLAKLVDVYDTADVKEARAANGKRDARKDLPPEAVLSMVKQFMDFSAGVMSASDKQYLWEAMPRWQDDYWKSFDPEIKALVDGALKGKIGIEEFWTAVHTILEP
jgi:hypothetical protein